MNNKLSYAKSTLGNIYDQALQTQLQTIGNNLRAAREVRGENLKSVASAVHVLPDQLEEIEDGNCDFRLKVLFDLCSYYEMDLEELVKQSGMMQLKIA